MDDLRRSIENAVGEPRLAAIHMGAVGPGGLVAWIESKEEIASVFVAAGGRMLAERSLARGDTLDFWYEGCTAQQLAWYGNRLVVVSRERGPYLRVMDPDGRGEEGMPLSDAWRIDRDLVFWAGAEPGLLYAAALPSLDARPPLPFRGAPASGGIRLSARQDGLLDILRSGDGANCLIDTIALPTHRQRKEYAPVDGLFDVVEQRLFPAAGAPMAGRLVIEAVARPFVCDAPWRGRWQPVPVWMPVYWNRHLKSRGRVSEADELMDLFDMIAAPLPDAAPEYGWDPGWTAREGQIELAVRHVRRRARVMARACHSGTLPAGWQCLLFDPAPQSSVPGSRVDSTGFPPVLRQVFEDLAPTSPGRLPSGA